MSQISPASAFIPRDFYCPILHDIFETPILASDGYTYERTAIEEWIRTNGPQPKSPMTNAVLRDVVLTPNLALRAAISAYKEHLPVVEREKKDLEMAIELFRRENASKINNRDRENQNLRHIVIEKDKEILELRLKLMAAESSNSNNNIDSDSTRTVAVGGESDSESTNATANSSRNGADNDEEMGGSNSPSTTNESVEQRDDVPIWERGTVTQTAFGSGVSDLISSTVRGMRPGPEVKVLKVVYDILNFLPADARVCLFSDPRFKLAIYHDSFRTNPFDIPSDLLNDFGGAGIKRALEGLRKDYGRPELTTQSVFDSDEEFEFQNTTEMKLLTHDFLAPSLIDSIVVLFQLLLDNDSIFYKGQPEDENLWQFRGEMRQLYYGQ